MLGGAQKSVELIELGHAIIPVNISNHDPAESLDHRIVLRISAAYRAPLSHPL